MREYRVSTGSVVKAALADCRRSFRGVAFFSAVVNLLMLAGPLYMLQVYDRVLSARSVPTLVALSAFLVGAYLFQGVLDIIRARVVVRAAALLDQHLDLHVHRALVRLGTGARGEQPQPLRDLDQIRSFLTGPGPISIVDLPWIPVFLFVCFLIHPWLGLASLAGALVLCVVTFPDRARQPLSNAGPRARGRGPRQPRGGEPAQQRNNPCHGHDAGDGGALVARQRALRGCAMAGHRCGQCAG